MIKHIIYLPIFILFYSCNEKKEKVIDKEEAIPNIAVVITQNTKIKSKVSFNNGVSMPNISYLEFGTLPDSITKYEINSGEMDTFRVNTNNSFIEVAHRYKTLHFVKYYLEAGDTLLIQYNDSVPSANLVNHKTLKFDLNYDSQMNEMLFSSQITPTFKAAFPLPFMDRSRDLQEESDRVINQAKTKFTKATTRESIILDSLKEYNLISSANYQHRSLNNLYNSLAFNLKYEINNEDLGLLSELKKLEISVDNEINYDKIVGESADSLLKYNSYINFLEAYLNKKYDDEVPMIKSKNGFYKDYRMFFDYIISDSILSDVKKEYFLYKNMVNIIENFTVSDREIYLKKYEAFGSQQKFINEINENFNLDGISDDLQLKDVNGDVLTLENLKSLNKGKLMYIDFWASWCKPCIELMPDSHQLRDSLADMDIEFYYFSIDESEKKWQTASEKYDLNVNSYLVNNRYNSVFLEEINLEAIPRYLLFDKNGELIQENAPDPSATELRKTIFKYLKN